MKKLVCFFCFSAITITLKAQIVSLDKKEVSIMRKAIKHNKQYQELFEPYKQAAYQALQESPNPIAVIQSQGLLAGDPRKTASLKSLEDAYKIYSLAFAYKVLGDKAMLNKATEYLVAWAKVNKATDDPINETKIEDIVTAYDLIRDDISAADRKVTDTWMHSKADALVDSKYAKGNRGTAINNWNSHRIKMITLIAYTLHDDSYDTIITRELEKQLNVNLNPDGTTHDLVERDAFHYQTYDLEPLISACIAIYRATGKDYFRWKTTNGSFIKNCVDYMTPFMTGEKKHPEFVKSTVPFDLKRAQNNEKGYASGTLFEPKNGVNTFALAAYFDKSYNKIIQQAMQNNNYINWRMALNNFTAK
ncbi:alginate lyase family protein [Mucilaginibacter segetis]|uniref:Alginate lyase family protein n=1 Tax=Mucilaginibacter segetis TaxID=2793071 RepID=A0A934PV60_9SPHI|nr:alginate lyase family protein [Mucilaginibacter segetis]MBK0379670.1 alginate lyase family protein [Mucilaginibacter segetis]